jgi:hypothetical protein
MIERWTRWRSRSAQHFDSMNEKNHVTKETLYYEERKKRTLGITKTAR